MKNSSKIIISLIFLGGVIYIKKRKKIINITNKLIGSHDWKKRNLSEITDITVHHGASADTATPYDYARHHVNNKNWVGIGYHYVIDQSGQIFQTNKLTSASWHNGYNNKKAIGICLVGNFDKKSPTAPQIASLLYLSKKLKKDIKSIKYLISHKEYVRGHTSCPGKFLNIDYFRKRTNLKSRVQDYSAKSAIGLIYNKNEADN